MNQLRITFIMLAIVFGSSIGTSQDGPPATRDQIDSLYQVNITKTRINGVYIPSDADDAYEEFVHLSPVRSIEQFKAAPEEQVARKLHFGIGRWMIVNWNFYEGSRLSHYLRNLGLMHPDDMADFLIVYFHRKLNGVNKDHSDVISRLVTARKEQQAKMEKIHFN
jgi:hypothetical protein